MKHLALALILVAGPAFADEPVPVTGDSPKPGTQSSVVAAPPKPVLTVEDGKKLYEYGVKVGMTQGMARAAIEAAQEDAKPVLEKLAPPKP